MLTIRFVVRTFWVALMILSAGVVSGQTYPNKPLRIVVSAPGGGTDFLARIIAQGLTGPLGQPVIVDNLGNIVGPEVVMKAPPDGHTLILAASSFIYGPLMRKAPYDPVRDFSPITLAGSSPLVLVVHPSLPVKSVKELIALAKARPGELNYASNGPGSILHLAAALFNTMAGVNIVHIPYKGTAQAASDMLAGQVQVIFSVVTVLTEHIKSGRLRALAVTSVQPSTLLPGLSTVAAAGLPAYEAASIYVVLAPAKTPDAVRNRLKQEIVLVLNRADVKERFSNVGVEAIGSSPEELTAALKSEIAKWGKVIQDAGIGLQ